MSHTTRTVLRLSGSDVKPFLLGLVTNNVDRLADGLVYAALLTPQGKFRADFFLVPDGNDVLLDVAAPLAGGLVQALTLYKLRSDVAISETDITPTRGLGDPPEGAFADPRHPSLGWRGYQGQTGQDVDWDALRVAECIPETGRELSGDTFILEAGFERLNGVDFKKGCYVGQEVTARMKHKTELRKGYVVVGAPGSAEVGTEITRDGKAVGQIFTQSDGRAIAYVRYDRMGTGMRAGDADVFALDA
jgi:folate-binding protein YgfZ